MAIDRRQLLVMGAAALAAVAEGGFPAPASATQATAGVLYASSVKLSDGTYAVVVVTESGEAIQTIPLAGRGHDICLSPDGALAIVFARRPGTFAVAFDPVGRKPPRLLQARSDRHFYGHGVFSPDGRLLYATENDFENARGVLGIYDVDAGLTRIGEFDTNGVGPHDLLLLEDGRTLCVANGGIETHPAAGRTKLNLDTMQPSLVFIDRLKGDIRSQQGLTLDIHRLSIRHLAMDGRGFVWFGGQWEGDVDESPHLVGKLSQDTPIELLPVMEEFGPSLKGYIGSMAASGDARLIAASAPRAGRTLVIDSEIGSIVDEVHLPDGCGVAPAGDRRIALSSGNGELSVLEPSRSMQLTRFPGLAFDNHLVRV